MGWAAADAAAKEHAKAAAVVAVSVPAPPPKPSTLPPFVDKCVKYAATMQRQKREAAKTAPETKKATADELAIAEMKTADERAACDKAVLEYYQSLQKQKAAAPKTKTS